MPFLRSSLRSFSIGLAAGVAGASTAVWRRWWQPVAPLDGHTVMAASEVDSSPPRKARVTTRPPPLGNTKNFQAVFKSYVLGDIIPISHDVALFRFLMPKEDDEFNLKPCSTLQAQFKTGASAAECCQRFYTPVTANGTKGYFDLIVKRKQNGRMTDHIFGLHVGDTLQFRSVVFKLQYWANRWEKIGMIAGGTGFTPMLQVIRHALTDPLDCNGDKDETQLSFLFCNRTERHILLKGLFDDLARRFPERFRVRYCVDALVEPNKKWDGYVGYVTPEMVKEILPPPGPNNIILVCGPDQLLWHVAGLSLGAGHTMSGSLNIQPVAPDINNLARIGGVLGQVGYDASNVYKF